MTIGLLARGRPTLDQYTIFMRADRMFVVGRYYGGSLTSKEVTALMEGLNDSRRLHPAMPTQEVTLHS